LDAGISALPYLRQLASLGVDAFSAQSPGHALALNMKDGKLINRAVAHAFAGEVH